MTFNQILDDYAKRGLLDGNLVARLSAAHEREVADALDTGAFVEAAHKRECGNAAKMREAAKYVQSTMERLRDPTDKNNAEFIRIWEIVSAALSEPPRNSDVGTADEQYDRFYKFCHEQECCHGCPSFEWKNCALAWAQMPYTEGGAE